MTTTSTQTKDAESSNGQKPDWIAKMPMSRGRSTGLERIGAAWNREDGGLCIRLIGKQVIDGDIYLYPNDPQA